MKRWVNKTGRNSRRFPKRRFSSKFKKFNSSQKIKFVTLISTKPGNPQYFQFMGLFKSNFDSLNNFASEIWIDSVKIEGLFGDVGFCAILEKITPVLGLLGAVAPVTPAVTSRILLGASRFARGNQSVFLSVSSYSKTLGFFSCAKGVFARDIIEHGFSIVVNGAADQVDFRVTLNVSYKTSSHVLLNTADNDISNRFCAYEPVDIVLAKETLAVLRHR